MASGGNFEGTSCVLIQRMAKTWFELQRNVAESSLVEGGLKRECERLDKCFGTWGDFWLGSRLLGLFASREEGN